MPDDFINKLPRGFSVRETESVVISESSFSEDENLIKISYERGILLLPCNNAYSDGLYGGETAGLYKALKHEFPTLAIETLDNSEDIVVERLYAADLILPVLSIPANVLLNIGISVLANFLCDYLKGRIRIGREKDTTAKLEINIVKFEDTTATTITYEGTVDGLEKLGPLLEKTIRQNK